ncbi:hypothetical protein [Frateuria defendens]|uniref:hypothetical protein n=1 Tax=Frateuria defendens TaxID=2219559 RepID=UPI001292FB4C|nr:hypothetical protein [Frateuria defendens]
MEERLHRNESAFRLEQKPSKRDVAASRERLLAAEARHRFHAGEYFAGRPDYLHIDNTALAPEAAAERVIAAFDLPLAGQAEPQG